MGEEEGGGGGRIGKRDWGSSSLFPLFLYLSNMVFTQSAFSPPRSARVNAR